MWSSRCRVFYYYKNIVKQENLDHDTYRAETIFMFDKFLTDNFSQYKIIICSINLPCFKDDNHLIIYMKYILGYFDGRKISLNDSKIEIELFDNLEIRTKHTIEFNDSLQELCNNNGYSGLTDGNKIINTQDIFLFELKKIINEHSL